VQKLTHYIQGNNSEEAVDRIEKPGQAEQERGPQMKVIEHDETVRCLERRGRAERQRSSEEEKVDRLDQAVQKTAQAEQYCSQKCARK
jgi:hypothetical protein